MPTVYLSTLIQDPVRRLCLVGQRSVDLPNPPFIGLEVILSDIEHFEISKVAYDTRSGEWLAENQDHTIAADQRALMDRGLPPETLEDLQEILQEAGFTTELLPMDVVGNRHLRLVRREE